MRRKIASFVAVLVVLALFMSGTFAWINFFQSATNEWDGGKPPGGTTHDDFCKPQKEVYIENWGGVPLFVRIRLDEYMEIGEGAALKGDYDKDGNWLGKHNPDNKSTSLLAGATIDDKNTWKPHIPVVNDVTVCKPSTPGFHDYWKWSMGGWKYYQKAPVPEREILSYVDQNTNTFNATGPDIGKTLDAKVVTMKQWIDLGQPVGEYWVIDTDGWAYWAAPLMPGEATGLLLNKVELIQDPDDSYYYAINVLAQMATKNKNGNMSDGTYGNYEDFYSGLDDDHKATDEGKELLDIITGGSGTPKPPVSIPAEKVTISGGDKDMTVGEKYKPDLVIEPKNCTETPVWSSSNSAAATVNPDTGEITAVGEGTATIKVTVGNKEDTIKITVKPKPPVTVPATGVKINGTDKTIKIGEDYMTGCTVTPSGSTDIPVWSSSDNTVATVDQNGKITGVGKGAAKITVKAGDKEDYITVTVAVPAQNITINGENEVTLTVGQEYAPGYTVNPENSTDDISWSSANSVIASVNADGKITANAPGTTKITISAGGKSHSITVNVAAGELLKIPTQKGEGPYDTIVNDDDSASNYSFKFKYINGEIIPLPDEDQNGSIKLSSIVAGNNYAGIGVKTVESKYEGYFTVGEDKDGDLAIIYNYIPELSVWLDAHPKMPVVNVKLLLTKDDCQDTPVTITMRFNGSLYRAE